MPFFAKVLLFFSVPALMFALLAVPSLRKEDTPKDDDSWRPLAAAGLEAMVPAGWRRVDPLTRSTPVPDERWRMGWPNRNTVHAALFAAALDSAQLTVFVGPSAELLQLVTECEDYYANSVMIEREPKKELEAQSGLKFRIERARYLPGPLSGEDSTRVLAWATVGERTILVNGGGPTATLSRSALETFLHGLSLVSVE
jgi:hypothetical protein